MRFSLCVAVLLSTVGSAHAHKSASRSGSLYMPRYAVCSEAPKKRVWCTGIDNARGALLEALDVGTLHPKRNNSRVTEPAHRAAVASVYFDVREAVPKLRVLLALRPTEAERKTHAGLTKNSLRAQAAYALSHLGDRKSAAAIAALVREFETQGHGSLWIETLEALEVLDATRAARYATDFLGRATNFRMSMPGGTSKTRALDVIRRVRHKPAIRMLARRTAKRRADKLTDSAFCRFMAARIELGDAELSARVRKAMTASYSGTWMATCDNKLILAFGNDARDAAVLVRHLGRPDRGLDHGVTNAAYGRLLHLLSQPGLIPRAMIRRELASRSTWPHIADPSASTFVRHFPVLHDAALAGAGDDKARARLYKRIADRNDDSGAAWLGAYWAIRLRLRGAAPVAAELMERRSPHRDSNRSGIYRRIRVRTLDAFIEAYPNDGRWTAMLVNADLDAAERGLYHLSRRRPKSGCDAALRAAYHSRGRLTDPPVEFAFVALTALGKRCRAGFERMAGDRKAPSVARGAALEMAAALGSSSTTKLADKLARENPRHPAVARARRIQ